MLGLFKWIVDGEVVREIEAVKALRLVLSLKRSNNQIFVNTKYYLIFYIASKY